MNLGYETVGLCPLCATDSPAYYEATPQGVFLVGRCPEHGEFREQAEKDEEFFRLGYDHEYQPVRGNLVLPITYRCNLACRYCYTLSNTDLSIPDRPLDAILGIISSYKGNISLIGGEPTVRDDLVEIISRAVKMPNINKVSVCSNGQRMKDIEYLRGLKDAGMSYVFFSLNDVEYEMSPQVHKNKLRALDNCRKLGIPVWMQGTISSLPQLDSFVDVLRTYKRVVFNVTLRAVKGMGINHPTQDIFASDMLEYLGKKEDYRKGTNPFNRHITLEGREAKICSWVYDMKRLDPIDWDYIISDDTMTTFFRGMRTDEVMLRQRLSGKKEQAKQPAC
jgi:MoaA/NifB/PqqE/SkfB family radical SAM enzyme